jgi:N-acetylmuramoyl-L-alanine amidase
MRVVERPSPNHDARPDGAVDMLVLHYTGMRTAEEALARLCDAQAHVSAHYTIDRDGCIYRHVPEDRRAWHAGISYWAGEPNVNARSVGIELVNPGHEFGYIPYSGTQIAALIELARGILARHSIRPQRVVGHSDVAPSRKMDPGELFPWGQLAREGIGLFPSLVTASAASGSSHKLEDQRLIGGIGRQGTVTREDARASSEEKSVQQMLAEFGYGVPPDVDWSLEHVIRAFQRHFRPSKIDGIADDETLACLRALLAAME